MTDEERRIRRDERNLCAQELRARAASWTKLCRNSETLTGHAVAMEAEGCARTLELNAEDRLGEMGEPTTACTVIRVDPNAPRLRNSKNPKKG